MLKLSLAEQFGDLRDLSVTVDNYLQSELFKEDLGPYGDYSVNDLLLQCYTIVLQEICEFGITLTADYRELLGDWYTAAHLTLLRKWLSSDYQLDILKVSPEDVNYISTLIDDETLTPTDVLLSYLEHFTYAHPDEDTAVITYLTPWLQANGRFIDHLKGLVDYLAGLDTTTIVPDIARAQRYIAKVQQSREYVEIAVRKVIERLPQEHFDLALIQKLLREYDRDKIAPDTIKIFSTIDLDEVPPFMIAYKNAQLDEHHRRSPHHIEYWLDPAKDPKPIPTKENLLLLTAHHAEPNTSTGDFSDAVNQMLEKGLNLFTPEMIAQITQYAQIIMEGAMIQGTPLSHQAVVEGMDVDTQSQVDNMRLDELFTVFKDW